jgi:TonB family protein
VKTFLSILLISLVSVCFAQETKIILKAPASNEITVIFNDAKDASMQVSKKDFLTAYDLYKSNYFERLADSTKQRYDKAIAFLKNKKSIKISLSETRKGNMQSLVEIVNNSVGADLLNQGAAKVFVNGKAIDFINSRSLIPSPEAAYWTYSDPNDQKFFYGAMFGSTAGAVIEVMFSVPEDEAVDVNKVFFLVEEQPEPDGISMPEYLKIVQSKIVYPKEAVDMKVDGSVFVEFIVNQDGTLSNFKTVKGKGFGLDEEATRVIKEGPKWKPGKQRGQVVRVKFVLLIKFVLP